MKRLIQVATIALVIAKQANYYDFLFAPKMDTQKVFTNVHITN